MTTRSFNCYCSQFVRQTEQNFTIVQTSRRVQSSVPPLLTVAVAVFSLSVRFSSERAYCGHSCRTQRVPVTQHPSEARISYSLNEQSDELIYCTVIQLYSTVLYTDYSTSTVQYTSVSCCSLHSSDATRRDGLYAREAGVGELSRSVNSEQEH